MDASATFSFAESSPTLGFGREEEDGSTSLAILQSLGLQSRQVAKSLMRRA